MKKIFAIAVVLSALGAGVMFANDNDLCVTSVGVLGGAIGSVGGPTGTIVGATLGTMVGSSICPDTTSTTDNDSGYASTSGWDY